MEKSLIVIEADKLELEPEAKKTLLENFTAYFEQAEVLQAEAKLIVIENETQLQEMEKAREIRLKLQKIRTGVEKVRIKLKEGVIRKGKAIEGFANIIKQLVIPIEDYLKEQENFIKIKQEKVLIELQSKRQMELSQYLESIEGFDLKAMDERVYQILLKASMDKYNQVKDAEKKAEEEAAAKQKAEKEEQERTRIENEKLKKEAVIEKEKQAKIEAEIRLKLKKAEEDYQAKLEKETEEKEKIQLELQEKENAAAYKIELEKRRKQAELKAKEAEALAPDKEKLNNLAIEIVNLKMPEVKNEKAKEIIKGTVDLLNKTSAYIKSEIINL